jgi:predicted transcriptional regulator
MTTKEVAREVIDRLPAKASLDDIIHALYIRAKFERGEREIAAGRGVPHENAKKRLAKWLTVA